MRTCARSLALFLLLNLIADTTQARGIHFRPSRRSHCLSILANLAKLSKPEISNGVRRYELKIRGADSIRLEMDGHKSTADDLDQRRKTWIRRSLDEGILEAIALYLPEYILLKDCQNWNPAWIILVEFIKDYILLQGWPGKCLSWSQKLFERNLFDDDKIIFLSKSELQKDDTYLEAQKLCLSAAALANFVDEIDPLASYKLQIIRELSFENRIPALKITATLEHQTEQTTAQTNCLEVFKISKTRWLIRDARKSTQLFFRVERMEHPLAASRFLFQSSKISSSSKLISWKHRWSAFRNGLLGSDFELAGVSKVQDSLDLTRLISPDEWKDAESAGTEPKLQLPTLHRLNRFGKLCALVFSFLPSVLSIQAAPVVNSERGQNFFYVFVETPLCRNRLSIAE